MRIISSIIPKISPELSQTLTIITVPGLSLVPSNKIKLADKHDELTGAGKSILGLSQWEDMSKSCKGPYFISGIVGFFTLKQ